MVNNYKLRHISNLLQEVLITPMRISARKGTKITENVFELKLTKPRKIILNLVTTLSPLDSPTSQA